MGWNGHCCKRRIPTVAALLFLAGILAACGREPEKERENVVDQTGQYGQSIEDEDYREEERTGGQEDASSPETDGTGGTQEEQDVIKERFGENCIAEQTFEVELSEYPGAVWFVPMRPAQDGQGMEIRIMRETEVLTELDSYVPDALADKPFDSLDAVSFYDMNYDGRTDIVLIATYGGTSFAAVYYGVGESGTDDPSYFVLQQPLSEALSKRVAPLEVKEIRNYISGGKKNGEFNGYREAYEAVARLCDMEGADRRYDLIYVDGDDIPELSACHPGYSVSLYTYADGAVYILMDAWGYGAMGNAGYAFAPRQNNVRNDNSDYAGAILYITYMAVSDRHTLDVTACIETYNFDDVNQNGYPDEEEMDSLGMYGVSYLDGVEISAEEAAAYDVGGYEFIEGSMTLDELFTALGKS